MHTIVFICVAFCLHLSNVCCKNYPIVINTWNLTSATKKAWTVIQCDENTAIDAIVEGCAVCEREQCDGSVGFGGSPDENSETTLDALLMDGRTMNAGAVASLRNIKNAIGVARHVLENTDHTLLVGERATEFAIMMGFKNESLTTTASKRKWQNWRENKCQPNYWINVMPDSKASCGPYEPIQSNEIDFKRIKDFSSTNHDTIGMIGIDKNGNIAAGTSTNGANHKIPGRVGDSPIPGSGAYANNESGAAAATGDGDIMMRFLPTFLAVEFLRAGLSPQISASKAIERIKQHYPNFFGGIIVLNKKGEYGAACNGMEEFPFSVAQPKYNVRVEIVKCN